MAERKYEVVLTAKNGTCDNSLFEKMAKKGDITATKLADVIGEKVTITGYAMATVTTAEKSFNINYFDTKEFGLISSGSEIFAESVKDYIEDTKQFILKEVKTNKGNKTYKAVPVLGTDSEENKPVEENKPENNDLPF